MIPELDSLQLPEWLSEISENSSFPNLDHLLTDSLYYPACGFNGTPVKYLAGNVYSFIYADYHIKRKEFLQNLNGNEPECGFMNYHSICQREVFRQDIVQDDWHPTIIPTSQKERESLLKRERECTPFGHWSVWQRNDNAGAGVGPTRFSFFFLAGEMSAIYQGLYCRLGISPRILAIIQPGAMGGEWEDVESDDSFFKRVVCSNTAGLPEYLLYGGYGRGFYEQACWRDYKGERIVQLPERYAGLWKIIS